MKSPTASVDAAGDSCVESKSPRAAIYFLRCPRDASLRYIGKADSPEQRLLFHIRDAASGKTKYHHGNWIRSLLRDGLAPEVVTLLRVPSDMKWQDAEKFFIASAMALGFRLTNATRGGDGRSLMTDESRAALGASMKGVNARPEVQAKKRAYFDDPKTKALRSAHGKRLGADPEKRARKSASLKATYGTDEARKKFSEHWRALWAKPEYAAKKSQAIKAAWADPEAAARRRAAMSEGKRQGWARKKAAAARTSA